MGEVVGILIGMLIAVAALTGLHISEKKPSDDSKKILSGGMIRNKKG